MEGLSHFFHINQDNMARKVLRQKKISAGFDAPRNSLDLAIETSQSYPAVGDNIPHSYEIRHDWSEKFYPNEPSMKKLINEEISTVRNTRRNAPGVVARLMGMDMLPADNTPSLSQQAEQRNAKTVANLSKEQKRNDSSSHVHGFSSSSSQVTFDSYQHIKDRDSSPQRVSGKPKKLKHREHPQEEELQKFKKEFEAWQTARFLECSKIVERDRNSTQWLAQETLNKEKIALYSNSRRLAAVKKPIERKGQMAKEKSSEGSEVKHHEPNKDTTTSQHSESYSSRSKDSKGTDHIKPEPKSDISSAPTRIVILRPGPERISDDGEESWVNSSSTSEERGSMEDFLEEVKERLRHELQGKSKGGTTMVRGCGIETPYSEKPSDPKQIAQQIAKQVRESVTRDLGMNLYRSESTRSYRNEIQYNGPTSPEFINRGTRRLLTERLTNVLKRSPDLHKAASETSNSSVVTSRQSLGNMNGGGNLSCWDIVDDESVQSVQSGSFRRGPDDDLMHHNDLSPRNLIRSMSAPVSGTSFGKLLLEDRHVLTGAHIRRKHEVVGGVAALDVTKRKKDRFNFKQKVSSIRYSFILKGRLFGRKLQSAEQPRNYEHYSRRDIAGGPTVVMNPGETNENSTEVPPSPASVCSSVYDDFWRGSGPTGYLSPTSASELSQLEETNMPRVFREISSNLTELRRQLNALDAGGFEETIIKEQCSEAEMELDDEAEAYIKELLVASGLYDGSTDKVLSRWDPLGKPISNTVYEEAEEARRNTIAKDNEEDPKRDQQLIREMSDRKLLLDLCNEALSTILGPPMCTSSFMKKALGQTLRPPQGKKLLKRVWDVVRSHLYPLTDDTYHSLDSMMARDLGSSPWFGLVNDEIDGLGKEIEYQIIRDLVDEIVMDMRYENLPCPENGM